MEQVLNPVELQRMAREALIAGRTKEEQRFANWKRALLTCGKEEVLSKLDFDPKTIELKDWIPELYEERPRKEVFDEQRRVANAKIDEVNKIINELNKRGLELLNEFNQMPK